GMQTRSTCGSFSASQTISIGALMCSRPVMSMNDTLPALFCGRAPLARAADLRDFSHDRQRDLFGSDRPEIETCRRLDRVDQCSGNALPGQILAQRGHLATAPDKAEIVCLDAKRGPQSRLIALALRGHDDKTASAAVGFDG